MKAPDVTEAERALLAKPTWTHDELVSIAFLARRLTGVSPAAADASRAALSDASQPAPSDTRAP